MTFNPAIPANSDSPSIFPTQAQTNWGRLNTLIAADHQFNNAAAANDGYHNLVHLTQQAPSGALAATGRLYSKSSAGGIHAFYMDDSGAAYQISPTMPIRAAVSFGSTGAINSQYNVSGVVRNSQGNYTITFTTAMPNANYIIQVTGQRGTVGSATIGCIAAGVAPTTAAVTVAFFESQGVPKDVNTGCVTILSVT